MTRPPTRKRGPAFVGDLVQLPMPKTSATAKGGSKKRHFYKRLPKEFRSDGFIYRQIASEENVAIYEQTWSGCRNPTICYEVIRVRYRDRFQIGEKVVEAYEVYPRTDSWGVDGFTVADKDAAFTKLREICR
jgi:hypothetical protein